MKFYSQCGEDKQLYEKYFKNYSIEGQKYYFEMGALDGIKYSNTKFYEDHLNWTGILVEGNPYTYTDLVKNRPKNKLMNVICSDMKNSLPFEICTNNPAVSSLSMTTPGTFQNTYYNHSKMLTLNTIPVSLDVIINNSGLDRIDLCVIDVEGHEINVLKSFSFKTPVVLWLIELLERNEQGNQLIMDIMRRNNCQYMGKCAHNGIFINKDYLRYFEPVLE